MEIVKRFLSKFAMDTIRAVAASGVAALLFAHFQWGQTPSAPVAPPPVVPTAANPQSTQLVRDEHDVMVQYLKAERAKERAEIEKEIREAKETAAKEIAAREIAAKEARDAKLARSAADAAARQVPTPKPTVARAMPVESANTSAPTVVVSSTPVPNGAPCGAPVSAAAAPPSASPNPTGAAASTLPPLNPPTVVQSLPEPPSTETPRDTSLADKAIDATHVKDVGTFMREVSGWFQHEDAPVPPADVRVSRYNNADM